MIKYSENKSKIKSNTVSVSSFGGISVLGGAHQLEKAENVYITAQSQLCARAKRATILPLTAPQGIYADDTLIYVDNGMVYYGGIEVPGVYLSAGEKQIHRLGKYVLILPDEVYFCPADTTDSGALSVFYSGEGAYVCCVDGLGNEIIGYGVTAKEPDGAQIGEYCAIKNGNVYVMRRFDGNIWDDVPCNIKILSQGIGAGFCIGDTVECSGLGDVIGDHFTVVKKTPDALYCEGVIPAAFTSGRITVRRIFPSMDICTVSGGRIYGVRRGIDKSGALVSRIYASAENDPLNFSPYGGGLWADVEVGGVFTAIGDRASQAVAFTESDIVELSIKNGRLIPTVIKGYGVERGASKTLACNGAVMYYKSGAGICAYDGSYPECISEGLGQLGCFENGSAGICVGGEYCLNVTDSVSKRAIYIYDIDKKRWMRQDDPGVIAYAKRREICYALCSDKIIMMNSDKAKSDDLSYCAAHGYPIYEDRVSWCAELGKITSPVLAGVIPVSLLLKLSLPQGSSISVSLVQDGVSSQEYELQGEICGIVKIPTIAKRGDDIYLKVSGSGDAVLQGYALEYREGGEACVWR